MEEEHTHLTALTDTELVEDMKPTPRSVQISKKAVIVGVVVVLALFITSYILTFVIPRGAYSRSESGAIIQGTFVFDSSLSGIKWWQFLLAPFMILLPSSTGFLTVWSILLLLLIIGAVFTALDESGILVYMIKSLNHRFGNKKYVLLFVIPFIFMFLGSTAGMFEELIPLVPIVILLCYALGWDTFVGLGMSVMAACFGFTAGVVNPFTVGISQTLGGMVMYSGIGMRLLVFVLAYIVLMLFLFPYAKKMEKHPQKSVSYKEDLVRKSEFGFEMDDFVADKNKDKALLWFGAWMLVIILFAVLSIFVHVLADYVMYVTIAIYLIAGIGACIMCGLKRLPLLKQLGKGTLTLLPTVGMILIAGGIRYVIETGNIMDTILYKSMSLMSGASPFAMVLIIYALIFVFEIFIPSGSAKAYLLMPIVFSMFDLAGLNYQIAILAFCFADGFANMLLPTNTGLLLILGMTTIDYGKWFKWSIKIQLALLAVSIAVLALAEFVVYA